MYSQGIYYTPASPHVDQQYLQHQLHYQPPTPLDLSYSQSMLPSNLLINSPYFQSSNTMIPLSPINRQFQNVNNTTWPPYLTSLSSNSNLDQLNISRTVILRNLHEDLTLNELLNEIDFGPIEYVKMFSKEAPPNFKDSDNNDIKNFKVCYISFINSKISINFHLKYNKNSHNLSKLKASLKNSKFLKINLNEGINSINSNLSTLNKQDFIKLKTLNYVLDFNATRCLLIKFNKLNDSSNLKQMESIIKEQCEKFGEIEDFKLSYNSSNNHLKILTHFTSIDSAIKAFEFYQKKIQFDQEDNDTVDDLPKISQVKFHKDRCDRTVIDKFRSNPNSSSNLNLNSINNHKLSSNSSLNSISNSPSLTKKNLAYQNNSIPEDIEETNSLLNDDLLSNSNDDILSSPPANIDGVDHDDDDDDSGEISIVSSNNAPSNLGFSMNNSHYLRPMAPPHAPVQSSYSQFNYIPVSMPNNSNQPPMSNSNQHALSYNPDPFNVGNRAIYLGNLHPNTSVEEIANNVRAGGLVELIKYHPEKRVCFITFIDAQVALKFYLNHQVLHQLIIHGNDVIVGWAKNHSGPLSREISLAVTAGASRNVYIGIKLSKDKEVNEGINGNKNKLQLPNEETLRADFSKFGDLEQINFYHNKECGFINFLNIVDAIKLIEMFEFPNAKENFEGFLNDGGKFYNRYKDFKISFAKDRCGNPPKFSFKKKLNSNYPNLSNANDSYGLDSFDYNQFKLKKQSKQKHRQKQEDGNVLDNNCDILSKEALKNSTISPPSSSPLLSPADESHETINEEAAMVFGIISNGTSGVSDEKTKEEVKEDVEEKEDDEPISKAEKKEDQFEEEEEDDDEDDDDDDVSIIIGSDDTTSTTPYSSQRDNKKKNQNYNRNQDYNKKYTSENYRRSSRNSSNVSLNSNYMKYQQQKYPPSPFFHQQSFPSQPQPHPQQFFYLPTHQPPQAQPPRPRMVHSKSTGYYVPHQGQFHPHHQQQNQGQFHSQYQNSFVPANYGPKNANLTSGSQVMAQYLAKSQHDNLIYAASILSNDIGTDEESEFGYNDYANDYRRRGKKH